MSNNKWWRFEATTSSSNLFARFFSANFRFHMCSFINEILSLVLKILNSSSSNFISSSVEGLTFSPGVSTSPTMPIISSYRLSSMNSVIIDDKFHFDYRTGLTGETMGEAGLRRNEGRTRSVLMGN